MQDFTSVTDGSGMGRLLMAETLGLAMARRAADILDRHRDVLTIAGLGQVDQGRAGQAEPCLGDPGRDDPGPRAPSPPEPGQASPDASQFALDDAIFTAVLDAANECLGRFDPRPPADRWCDALLYLLDLARYATDSAG
jgi:hypothetical protein